MSGELVEWNVGQKALVALGIAGFPCYVVEQVERWVECTISRCTPRGVTIVGWCTQDPCTEWRLATHDLDLGWVLRPHPNNKPEVELSTPKLCNCALQDLLALGCRCGGI